MKQDGAFVNFPHMFMMTGNLNNYGQQFHQYQQNDFLSKIIELKRDKGI
jgi:hypothetical protein